MRLTGLNAVQYGRFRMRYRGATVVGLLIALVLFVPMITAIQVATLHTATTP